MKIEKLAVRERGVFKVSFEFDGLKTTFCGGLFTIIRFNFTAMKLVKKAGSTGLLTIQFLFEDSLM